MCRASSPTASACTAWWAPCVAWSSTGSPSTKWTGSPGSLIGRARTATFRTGDLSGLDVLAHVTKGIGDATGEDFTIPAWMLELVAQGKLGDKTGGGFYTKTKDGTLTFDWKTQGVRAAAAP